MDNQDEYKGIDYTAVFHAIWKKKMVYLTVLSFTILFASL